ncbi:hydrogenase formation protein HypD [Trichodesmium erythraeum 21-75]|nr:hydrogenase formation protein HypD [Trichodesmium erythraeum 21-75]
MNSPTEIYQDEIKKLCRLLAATLKRKVKLMPICAPNSLMIAKYNLNAIEPECLEFIQGYGEASWSLPSASIDHAIALSQQPEIIFTTCEETINIRGSQQNLVEAKAQGIDIRIVSSPHEALQIALKQPTRQIIFFGVGFEDNAFNAAETIIEAQSKKIDNFSIYCNYLSIVPALKAILDSPIVLIDGFIAPSQLSATFGLDPYRFLVDYYHKPLVVADEDPLSMLQATLKLLQQLVNGCAKVETQTLDFPSKFDNSGAMPTISQVYQPRDFYEWRGMGSIDYSGLKLKSEYVQFDAEVKFNLPKLKISDPHSSQCWAVLSGVLNPCQCKVFGPSCNPKNPMGTFMASSDGVCNQQYNALL